MTKKYQKFEYLVATGFGLGLLPKAPGTWGTLGGVVLYFVLLPFSLPVYLFIIFLAFVWGCIVCENVAKRMKVYDHGSVVWDEIVGYCMAMAGAPKKLGWVIAGFILFRLFDIIKPWPIRQVDTHMKSGVGMMLDDLLAGLAVCIIFQVFNLFIK